MLSIVVSVCSVSARVIFCPWYFKEVTLQKLYRKFTLFKCKSQRNLGVCLFAIPHLSIFHSLYLLLKLKNGIKQCLCRRWTARYIYINRDNTVTPTHNWVRVVIISSTIGTASHGDDPFGVICLIINSAQCWSHFVGYGTGNNEAVSLTRACTKHHPKSVHVIPVNKCIRSYHSCTSN